MDYERRREAVSAWIDGETTADEADEVLAWLMTDPELAEHRDAMLAIDDELAQRASWRPVDVMPGVMAQVRAEVAAGQARRLRWLWIAAAVLAGLALLLALLFQAELGEMLVAAFATSGELAAGPPDLPAVPRGVALDWAPLAVLVCLTASAVLVLPAAVVEYQRRLQALAAGYRA